MIDASILPDLVTGALGTDVFVVKGAVERFGPQKEILLTDADSDSSDWHAIAGVFGGASSGDNRNFRLHGGTDIPGPRREERSFSIKAAGIQFRPSPQDRLIEAVSGKNWQIVNVTDRYAGSEVSYYVLSIRELKS